MQDIFAVIPLEQRLSMREISGHSRIVACVLLATCMVIGYVAYHVELLRAHRISLAQAHQRAAFDALSLESTLARYEALPKLIAFEKKLADLLDHPTDVAAQQMADRYLYAVQQTTKLRAAYLMDASGLTLASSNWDSPTTFVGQRYAFRPYFREALRGDLGRFYGIGQTTGEPGYFLAAPVHTRAGATGVVAVKIDLGEFEAALSQSGDTALLIDADGVIFLSSIPSWRYRTLMALSTQERAMLRRTHQYGSYPLEPLGDIDTSTTLPRLVRLAQPNEPRRTYLTEYVPVGHMGWQLAILINPQQDRTYALAVGVGAGFIAAFIAMLFIIRNQRRKRHEERQHAKVALENAHAELETRIAMRTSDLTKKIAALDRAQHILRETRDSAVQAGKLAVLGQMSAGITHELSQPLAALTTLSDNTICLAARGELSEINQNVLLIGKLAARMGHIVSHIKAFSRKNDVERIPVNIHDAIHQALMLVEPRRKQVKAKIELSPAGAETLAWGNAVRIEQVLVNLLRNGLDATAHQPGSTLSIAVQMVVNQVLIKVRDHGPGISEEIRQRLFEPFLTTKPAGQGLGLGLAVSLAIVEDMGGQLLVDNAPDGGVEGVVILERA